MFPPGFVRCGPMCRQPKPNILYMHGYSIVILSRRALSVAHSISHLIIRFAQSIIVEIARIIYGPGQAHSCNANIIITFLREKSWRKLVAEKQMIIFDWFSSGWLDVCLTIQTETIRPLCMSTKENRFFRMRFSSTSVSCKCQQSV